ncbi:MAG: serine/threonine protein kinase, partial [Planctomycetes bacterium]|nr:serine/threonine protein kinase [Planctomycetota bacterium]
AAQKIEHPLVARVLASGMHEGRAYLAQERIDGRSLRFSLDGTPWPIPRALRCAADLAEALAAAHAVEVVHRDLKPENVILDAADRAHLVDFGVARASEESSLTRTGELVGTPQYMAPEQVLEEPSAITPATDLHALGLLLYELLTARSPFAGRNLLQTLRFVESLEPEPPSRLRTGVPPALDALVLRLLAKDARERPQRALDVARELRAFANELAPPRARSKSGWFSASLAFAAGALAASLLWMTFDRSSRNAREPGRVESFVRRDPATEFARLFREALEREQVPSRGRDALEQVVAGGDLSSSAIAWRGVRGVASLHLGYFQASRDLLEKNATAFHCNLMTELHLAAFGAEGVIAELFPGGASDVERAWRAWPAPKEEAHTLADRCLALLLDAAQREDSLPRSQLRTLHAEHPHYMPARMLAVRDLTPAAERARALEHLADELDWRSPERHLVRAAASCERCDFNTARDALRLAVAAGAPRERCDRLLRNAAVQRALHAALRLSRGGYAG